MDQSARKTSAHFIIHSVAVSAAAFAFAFSWAPGVGPTLGDTTVLTSLTIAMTMMLGKLFDKEIGASSAWAVGSTAIGFALGTSLLKGALSFIPAAGPWINATITLSLHEAIGWGLFSIFKKGLDPTKMTSEELKKSFKEGKKLAAKYKRQSKEMDNIKKQMPSDDRELINKLEKAITSKDASEDERMNSILEMAQIYKKHGYDVDL